MAMLGNGVLSWVFLQYCGTEASAMMYLAGAFVTFIFLVDNRDLRLIKGYLIIAYGVVIQIVYELVFASAVRDLPGEQNLKMMLMMLTIASSGAGGSLIAAHSDRSSTDADAMTTPHVDEPLAARLKLLEEKVKSFDGKLDRLITLAGIACVGLMLAGLVATALGLAC